MSPRQQKAYEAIKACLLRPEAVARLAEHLRRAYVDGFATMQDCVEIVLPAWADEQARTLVGVMGELQHEENADREAAARALLAELAHGPERMDDQRPRVWWGNLQAAIGRVRDLLPVRS